MASHDFHQPVLSYYAPPTPNYNTAYMQPTPKYEFKRPSDWEFTTGCQGITIPTDLYPPAQKAASVCTLKRIF